MSRLTDNDRKFGPIVFGRTDWKPIRLVWSSGGGDPDAPQRNTLTGYFGGWAAMICLPNIIRPLRVEQIVTSWDAETVARLGRNYYFEIFPREYGFSICDGFLQVFFGAQTHDSTTTQSWSKFIPWQQWRFVRFSLYRPDGEHFWTQYEGIKKNGFADQWAAQEACPKIVFLLDDFDGERITATCHIEERQWKFGEGWFKWLSLFRRSMVRRSLDIKFDKEVGPEKGSWKGGTVGTSTDIAAGESCEQGFRRFCEQEHRAKGRRYSVTFVGAA